MPVRAQAPGGKPGPYKSITKPDDPFEGRVAEYERSAATEADIGGLRVQAMDELLRRLMTHGPEPYKGYAKRILQLRSADHGMGRPETSPV